MLPDWATDCLKRHDPQLRDRDRPELRRPLILYEKRDNAMRVSAVDENARAAGLHEGQSLSDARALCPGLVAREADHAFLAMMFARFADWHANLSPIVAIMDGAHGYGDLMLDITGVSHLFGGERALLDLAVSRLESFGYRAAGAIAPSIGAAWALCHFAPGTIAGEDGGAAAPTPVPSPQGGGGPDATGADSADGQGGGAPRQANVVPLPAPPLGHPRDQGSGRVFDAMVARGEDPAPIAAPDGKSVAALLAPLPVAALRLDVDQITALRQVGLKRIGQLYGRERRGMLARFGDTLLLRLDQALGLRDEKLVPRLPVPERYADRKFAEPIGLIDDVLLSVTDLSHRVSGQLQAEGAGARTFHLMLFRVDHQIMHLAVNAARATRDARHIVRLFANRIERLTGDFDAGFGIEMVRLMASSVSDLDAAHAGNFLGAGDAAALDRLYDRMASRLGAGAVLRLKPLDSHIPERAVTLEPVVARTQDTPDAAAPPAAPRPLRLFPSPEPVKVIAEVPDGPPARMVWRRIGYRFVKSSGPERIGVEWWNPGEGALTRDYYSCEDDEGRRFWLFREGLYEETEAPRWFLHGLFG